MIATRKSTRLAAAVAALAVASAALFASTADAALPVNSAPAGVLTQTPSSGTRTTLFNISVPAAAACAADSATGGYRWSTFIASASIDTSQLTWPGGNPTSSSPGVVQPLFNAGNPIVDQNTAIGTGAIVGIPVGFDLATFPANFIPAGQYKIGIACTLAGVTEKFWQTTTSIAVDGAGVITTYSPVVIPGAPVLASPLTVPASGQLAGTFTAPAATPAATGYTVTAVPTSGPTVTLSLAAGSTSFTLTGLTNGTAYSVTVTQTNSAGTSAASNAVVGTPSDPNSRPAVTGLVATPGVGSVTLNWVAPTGVAPTGYTIAVSPTVAGSPFTAAAGAVSFPVPGLTAGTTYTFTVTPTHPAPFVAGAASTSAAANAAQVIIQDVTVVRPAGALVLTQRCGVNGALPIEPASPGFLSLPALLASVNQVGTAPTLTAGGAVGDPEFPNYPSPATPTYPTHCGVNLGSGQLVTSGPLAGQYYTASGLINQVTVSDTRDTDSGWTVNGTMSAFTTVGGSFSGNYLGWSPVVTSTSGVTSGGYDQTVTAGATVLPDTAAGLATPKALSSAAAGAGLGIASFDARLKLLIPVSARAGTYNGTLTFTVV